MTDGEDELWNEVKKDFKPLKNQKAVVVKTPVRKRPVIREVPFSDLLPPKAITSSPLPKKRVKQLKQQKIPVEATLDLHGMNMVRAHDAVRRFILSANRNELRCIEIITGIGKMEGTGQLKRFFPLWIDEPALKQFILHVEINPVSRGGSFLLLLRRNKVRD